ncbi:MAG: glycoside hydrolase family 104 protein [Deltaproteobacteria bacterium]|nr:glycoside hydrolase family 104 protein [Deltaproteobacteria bacterium]
MTNTRTLLLAALAASALLVTTGCSQATEETPSDGEGEVVGEASDELGGDSCAPSLAAGAVPSKHKALLDTIAVTEGTRGRGKDGYNVTFAYRYFSSCVRHPNMNVCSGRLCSTAAGRYQFLKRTWDSLGYANFGPANQEKGAMKLVGRRGVTVPTGRAMTATEFTNAMNRLSYEWASLPPGRYGQPSYSMSATRAKYCGFAGC